MNSLKPPYLSHEQFNQQDWILLHAPTYSMAQIPQCSQLRYHMTSGRNLQDENYLVVQMMALLLITANWPTRIGVKTQVAAFHLRKGSWIGAQVVLDSYSLHTQLATWLDVVSPALEEWVGGSPESLMDWPEIQANFERFTLLQGMDLQLQVEAPQHQKAWLQLLGVPTKQS